MASHEFLDHVSETVLRLSAPDLDQLFSEAARALGSLEQSGIAATGERLTRRLTLESSDLAGLLVDFLNELVWIAETERLIPCGASARVIPPYGVEADLELARLATTPSLVKAATRHDLTVESGPGGASARVTLDV